jgi:DNA-binding NarL/FixJ family response regulator
MRDFSCLAPGCDMSLKNVVTHTSGTKVVGHGSATLKVVLLGTPVFESLERAEDIEVLCCEDISEVPRFLVTTEPTVLMVELPHLSDSDRKRLFKQIAQFEVTRAIAIVESIDQKTCEILLRSGFVGALRQDESAATVLRAMRAVVIGELWFPRMLLSNLLRGFLSAADPNRPSSREMEILALIAADLNNQQVADKLCLSRETVRWHIKNLHAKFGTRSRKALRDQIRLLNRLKAIPPKRESMTNSSHAMLT